MTGVEITVWPDTLASLERAALLAQTTADLAPADFRRWRDAGRGFLGDQEDWSVIRDDLLQWAQDARRELAGGEPGLSQGSLDRFGDYTMGDAA